MDNYDKLVKKLDSVIERIENIEDYLKVNQHTELFEELETAKFLAEELIYELEGYRNG
ncbi:MAG: hypothetical protein ACQEQF_00760 [Bacillota bacterium]